VRGRVLGVVAIRMDAEQFINPARVTKKSMAHNFDQRSEIMSCERNAQVSYDS
jgi:hypothetical protein